MIEEIDEAAAIAEDSPEKRQSAEEQQVQSLLQDFGFIKNSKEEKKAKASAEHSAVREKIQKAAVDRDEVALNEAIDEAREIGPNYKFGEELKKAEGLLYELCQCPSDEFFDPAPDQEHL